MASNYYARKERGQCVQCEVPAWNGYTKCEYHVVIDKEKARLYREANRELCNQRVAQERKERIARGQCLSCKKAALPNNQFCAHHKIKNRDKYFRYTYSISQEELELLRTATSCDLCGGPFEGAEAEPLAPVIDHSHSSGNVRAVIHQRCNLGIGVFKEDTELLKKAIEYLEKYNVCIDCP